MNDGYFIIAMFAIDVLLALGLYILVDLVDDENQSKNQDDFYHGI